MRKQAESQKQLTGSEAAERIVLLAAEARFVPPASVLQLLLSLGEERYGRGHLIENTVRRGGFLGERVVFSRRCLLKLCRLERR